VAIYEDLNDRESHADHLERCRRDFEATGNPLYAWEALGVVWFMRRLRLSQDIPGSFTSLPESLSRRNRPSRENPDRDFLREAHAIVTGASKMEPTAEHLDALWSFVELPEWLGEYLEGCGKRLIGMPMEVVDQEARVKVAKGDIRSEMASARERPFLPAKAGEGPGSIGRAFRFTEGLALARKHWGGAFDPNERLALRVVQWMWSEGRALDAAAEEFEGAGGWPERRTVRRAVEHARLYALRWMRDRLREAGGELPAEPEVARAYSDLCRRRNLTKQPG
jgi:hypothetical protein